MHTAITVFNDVLGIVNEPTDIWVVWVMCCDHNWGLSINIMYYLCLFFLGEFGRYKHGFFQCSEGITFLKCNDSAI